MKIIVNENKLYKLTSKYLDNVFDKMKKINPTGTRKTYFQFLDENGKLMMDGIFDKELLVHTQIWEPLKSFFSLSDEQVVEAIERWFEENYGTTFNGNIVVDETI